MENTAIMQTGYGLQSLTVDELGERVTALMQDIEFSASRMMTDMVGLGELLIHVKGRSELGRYGNFERFIETSGVSKRMAQYSMEAYRRFSEKPEILGRIGGVSKLIEVLALPAGETEAFIENNDISQMSVREVRKKVREINHPDEAARPDAQDAHESEALHSAREKAEAAARTADKLKEQIEDKDAAIAALNKRIEQMTGEREDALQRAESLKSLLAENKERYGRLESELSDMKRQAANSASRAEEKAAQGTISGGMFSGIVKRFLTECCEIPHMHNAFYRMDGEERREYADAIDKLANFVRNAQNALVETDMEGVTVR